MVQSEPSPFMIRVACRSSQGAANRKRESAKATMPHMPCFDGPYVKCPLTLPLQFYVLNRALGPTTISVTALTVRSPSSEIDAVAFNNGDVGSSSGND